MIRKIGRLFPFNWIGDLFRLIKRSIRLAYMNIHKSIRLQLIVTFGVCLLAASLTAAIGNEFFGSVNRYAYIDYTDGQAEIDMQARRLTGLTQYGNQRTLEQLESDISGLYPENNWPYKVMILNLDGKVLYKTQNASETEVDLYRLIGSIMQRRSFPNDDQREYTSLYPMTVGGQKLYLIVIGVPRPSLRYHRGSSPLTYLLAVAVFFVLFYWLTKRKMRYVEELADGLIAISKGSLRHRVAQKSEDELGSLAMNINRMAEELQHTIEEERKAERTKNELITNVSHDLRTPLTLIMGYLRLLKDKQYENEQQSEQYLQIAYSKSEKLKSLIEDLFEFTKLSNQGVRMSKERVCLSELLEQLFEEMVPAAEENQLTIVRELPSERVWAAIDASQLIRVIENLLTNAIKFSSKPGTISVSMSLEGEPHRGSAHGANSREHTAWRSGPAAGGTLTTNAAAEAGIEFASSDSGLTADDTSASGESGSGSHNLSAVPSDAAAVVSANATASATGTSTGTATGTLHAAASATGTSTANAASSVVASQHPLQPGTGWVRICVANYGEPVPEEELPRLFDRFYRVDAARSSDTGGSGLGLAIARSIVQAHGGDIWAESEGRLIRFCIRLKAG